MPSNPLDVPFAIPDFARARRVGIPEVILSHRKTTAQVMEIVRQSLEVEGRAILSRVHPELERRLRQTYAQNPDVELEWIAPPRALVIRRKGYTVQPTDGRVGVLTAGTSDIPVAEEAALVCRETGCQVRRFYDVGVAGLHRLFQPLKELIQEFDADVLIVVAGMDGALPSVVSGLVDVPVIGIPTSVGYGLGGRGLGALVSMLQTCAPGLAVVNIDNGVGGGAVAALIARRAAARRQNPPFRGTT
ncbi:MAG: nickel pincer cofactor biosynthesis protein LarB [Anaerolineae bacterium]